MIVEIKVPQAGESVSEGDIAQWFVEDGDSVEVDDMLCELETDKASMELPAPAAGTIKILVPDGETVLVGQVIGTIDTDSEEGAADAPTAEEAPAPALAPEPESTVEEEELTSPEKAELPSPAARKLMAENSISAQDVKGHGKDGRITKNDVLNVIKEIEKQNKVTSTGTFKVDDIQKASAPKPRERANMDTMIAAVKRTGTAKMKETPTAIPAPVAAPVVGANPNRMKRKEKMSRLRRTIADKLTTAQQTQAQLTTFQEVDLKEIKEVRAQFKGNFKEKYGVNLGFMSFFARAACIALKEFPAVNAQIEENNIVYHDYCDVGIAISTPKGLLVPVIRNCEQMSFAEIEGKIVELAIRGREGKIGLDELQGGTFTITNGGTFGSMLSTPIVNFPQSGILGMHNIVDRPVAVNGQVEIRPIMYLALSYDHRIIDGAESVRFLYRIKELLENPVRLMLDV